MKVYDENRLNEIKQTLIPKGMFSQVAENLNLPVKTVIQAYNSGNIGGSTRLVVVEVLRQLEIMTGHKIDISSLLDENYKNSINKFQ